MATPTWAQVQAEMRRQKNNASKAARADELYKTVLAEAKAGNGGGYDLTQEDFTPSNKKPIKPTKSSKVVEDLFKNVLAQVKAGTLKDNFDLTAKDFGVADNFLSTPSGQLGSDTNPYPSNESPDYYALVDQINAMQAGNKMATPIIPTSGRLPYVSTSKPRIASPVAAAAPPVTVPAPTPVIAPVKATPVVKPAVKRITPSTQHTTKAPMLQPILPTEPTNYTDGHYGLGGDSVAGVAVPSGYNLDPYSLAALQGNASPDYTPGQVNMGNISTENVYDNPYKIDPQDYSSLDGPTVDAAAAPGLWDRFKGLFSGAFDKTDLKNNTKTQGWASPMVNLAQGIGNYGMAQKQLGLANRTMDENVRQFDLNYGNQVQTYNTNLEDRQRAKMAASRNAESIDSYMARNRLK